MALKNTVSIENLIIGYHRPLLENPFSLSLNPGEIWLLAGRNGSGKSTLLKTLSGLINPIKGNIYIHQQNLFTLDYFDRASLAGLVLSTPPLVGMLTAIEMVATSRLRFSKSPFVTPLNDESLLLSFLKQTGVEQLANRHFEKLSDGEKQKVMLARCLAQETPLIILDEPTAFLDYPSRKNLFSLISELSKSENKIFVLSTHDIDMALPFVSGLIFLNEQKNAEIIYNKDQLSSLKAENLFVHGISI